MKKYIKCDQQQHAKLLAPFYSFYNFVFNRTKSHFAEDVSAVTKNMHTPILTDKKLNFAHFMLFFFLSFRLILIFTQ